MSQAWPAHQLQGRAARGRDQTRQPLRIPSVRSVPRWFIFNFWGTVAALGFDVLRMAKGRFLTTEQRPQACRRLSCG